MHLSNAVLLSMSISLATSVAQVFLLVILAKKGLQQRFRFFFAYIAAYAAISTVLTVADLVTGPASIVYFYLFWGLNVVLMLLEFGVMYEVFVHAVKPYEGLIDLAKMVFGWAALFLFLAAALTAFSSTGSQLTRCIIAISYLDRGLRMMQCGLLILFFLFERRLGLSWRSYSVCIALGLGVVASTELSLSFFRPQHPAWALTFDLANNIIYLSTIVVWSVCFRLPQPARKNVLDSPSKLIFQRWNEALLASPFSGTPNMAMATADPFLPGVEKTVDRILSRKMVS